MCEQTPVRQILIASVPAMSTSVTPGQFGFIFRRRRRLRRFVILPSDGSGGALIRIRCAARRRADRFIDRLSRFLISTFTPWSWASDILAGRTFTVSHKSPQNYRLVMKLLCREDYNGGASRSDVGDRRSKLGSEPLWGHLKIRIITYAKTRQAIDFAAIGVTHSRFDMQRSGWVSVSGISQSRHSRRVVPMSLSQIEVAVGLRGGDFNTLTPSFTIDSSRCVAKMLSRSCSRYSYLSCGPIDSRNCCSVQAAVGCAVTLQ
jgi:hypothetical protein